MLLQEGHYYLILESATSIRSMIDHHLKTGTDSFTLNIILRNRELQRLQVKFRAWEVQGKEITWIAGTEGPLEIRVKYFSSTSARVLRNNWYTIRIYSSCVRPSR